MAVSAAMTTALAMGGAPALAQGDLGDQLQVCARIGSKSARLECYDSVAAAARQGGAAAGSGAPMPRDPQGAPPPAAAGPGGFGAEQVARPAAPPGPPEPGEVEVAVVSSRDNGLDMWQFTLADGAVWRMTERVANFRPPAPNEPVRIRRGALGSYLMRIGQQASVRVERVR